MSNPRPVMLTAAAVARRVGVAGATLTRRLEAGVIEPDGLLETGQCRPPALLFHESRLADIRQALLGQKAGEPIQ